MTRTTSSCCSAATARSLEQRFERLAGRLTVAGALWVCWPKKSSGVVTDVTENGVREYGLAAGLVDVKIAAVDATLVRPEVRPPAQGPLTG